MMPTREELYTALRNADKAGDNEGAQKLAAYIKAMPADAPAPSPAKPVGWSDVPGQALSNLPSSAGNFVGSIYQAVRHPIDTLGNVMDIADGGARNLIRATGGNPDKIAPDGSNEQKANATGQFFKDRYGSAQGLRNTLATDPVGVAADASALLSGGATVAGKIPALARTAGALDAASSAVNPLAAVARVVPKVGNGLANVIGGAGTHTGADSLKQAFQSTREGGQGAQQVVDNMRGNVPMTDVLDDAKANVAAMGRAKSEAYRSGMAALSGDKTVLDFAPIDQAIKDAGNAISFKGQAKNAKAQAVQQQIAEEVDKWKALDPAEYHTPEGLDALKQRIGGIVESIPMEEKTAGMVGKQIYNSIKGEIVKQAPTYANTMKAYSEASDQIKEIERALSLGNKASADTAMRKLQSLTRNNVNTNYGNRIDLARTLEQQGGNALMPALAGQALSTWTPRGLGGAVAGGLGMGGYALGGAGAAIPVLAVQSPRLMGEAAVAAGKGARAFDRATAGPVNALARLGMTPAELSNYLYQVGRLPQ